MTVENISYQSPRKNVADLSGGVEPATSWSPVRATEAGNSFLLEWTSFQKGSKNYFDSGIFLESVSVPCKQLSNFNPAQKESDDNDK